MNLPGRSNGMLSLSPLANHLLAPTLPLPQNADGYQLQDLRCGKCGSVAASHLQHHCDVCGGHLKATQAAVSWLLFLLSLLAFGEASGK